MPNRADRRRKMREQTGKNQKMIANFSQTERLAALYKNGFTEKDIQDAFEEGRQLGFEQAGWNVIRTCYAGMCLALHDVFGFGEERCFRAISATDEKVKWALHHQELVDEVLKKTGLSIEFDDVFDRVQKCDGDAK